MEVNQPAFIASLPNADKPVSIPLSPSAPAIGDVGVVFNGTVFPVYPAQAGDVPCMVVDVPTEPTKGYCIALEPPQILPLQKNNNTYLTLLDAPLETDAGFDDSWKDQPGYVKNTTGLTFFSITADEYDDPETIQYVYTTASPYPYPAMRNLNASGYSNATAPCMVEQNAGGTAPNPITESNPVAANGTVWDRTPLVPEGTSNYQTLYVRAFTEGRIVSNVSSINYRLLPGRLTVEYNAGTKELKVTCPGTVQPAAYSNFYCKKDDSTWLYQNNALSAAKATLTASGSYTIYWLGMPSYGLPNTWAGYFLWSGSIAIDGDEPTESFQKTIWLPIPTSWQPIAMKPTKVAVKLVNSLTANYYISPNGSGNGLTKDAPGSWASVLGTIALDGSGVTIGSAGYPSSPIVVRAASGSYAAASGRGLFLPSNITVIGGHDSEFKSVAGKSTISSDASSYGTMENFSIHFYCISGQTRFVSSSTAIGATLYHGSFRNCDISGSDSNVTAEMDSGGTSYYYPNNMMTIGTGSNRYDNCTFDLSGWQVYVRGNLYGCNLKHRGSGQIILPAIQTLYDIEWGGVSSGYNTVSSTSQTNYSFYSCLYLEVGVVVNSTLDISGVFYCNVGSNGAGQQIKNSTVKVVCAGQTGGLIQQGRIKDGEIEYAKSTEQRPDGSYFDTWYEGATAEGHDYHDQPWQAYYSEWCWHHTGAEAVQYCMSAYNVGCGFGVAVNSTIEISVPSTPNGGNGGNGKKKEVTIPSHTEWEYYDTGRVETYTWTDDEGVEHVETYPIWDYHEVTIPSHPMRFWVTGASGQSACDSTVTLPKNLRKCKVKLTIAKPGNGGNGGNGSNDDFVSGEEQWLDICNGVSWYTYNPIPPYRAAGIPGLGGRIFVNSPVRWTTDCEFDFNVAGGGVSGSNNFSGGGVVGNVPGSIVHPDGCDYLAWRGNARETPYRLLDTDLRSTWYGYFYGVISTQSYFEPTNGYYGGKGGRGWQAMGIDMTNYGYPTVIENGTGGNGVPVDGFRTPGSGGGIKLGDFWE